jgi:hypothetical protein
MMTVAIIKAIEIRMVHLRVCCDCILETEPFGLGPPLGSKE